MFSFKRKEKKSPLQEYNELLIEQLEKYRISILTLTEIVKDQQKEINSIKQKHNELVDFVLKNTEES